MSASILSHPHRIYHLSMIRVLALLGVCLLLAPVYIWSAESVRVPLILSGGTIAIRGTMDGHDGLLLLDSGASTTCLFPAQARSVAYSWKAVRQRYYTANGTNLVRRVAERSTIRIGGISGIEYRAHNLVVLPASDAPHAIGLLGCDFLLATGAVIDFAHGQLILHQPATSTAVMHRTP